MSGLCGLLTWLSRRNLFLTASEWRNAINLVYKCVPPSWIIFPLLRTVKKKGKSNMTEMQPSCWLLCTILSNRDVRTMKEKLSDSRFEPRPPSYAFTFRLFGWAKLTSISDAAQLLHCKQPIVWNDKMKWESGRRHSLARPNDHSLCQNDVQTVQKTMPALIFLPLKLVASSNLISFSLQCNFKFCKLLFSALLGSILVPSAQPRRSIIYISTLLAFSD